MENLLELPQKLQEMAKRPTRGQHSFCSVPMPGAIKTSVPKSPATPASARVFAIVELLEKILLDVDLSTLLQAQRTSRLFQRVILSTRSLRQKLWFEPPRLANKNQLAVLNPIIEAHSHKIGIESILIHSHNGVPLISTTFQHRSQLAVLGPGSWRDMILADVFHVTGAEPMIIIWHKTLPGQHYAERLAGEVAGAGHVRLGDCVDALLLMRIRAEGFDFEDFLADLMAQREVMTRGSRSVQ